MTTTLTAPEQYPTERLTPEQPQLADRGQATHGNDPVAVQPAPRSITQVQAEQRVERYVRERRDTDKPLVGWGLYFFLLSWVTAGIYPIVVFFRRINRADLFRDRKEHYYRSVLEFTKQYAEESGSYDAVHHQVEDLDRFVKDRFTTEHKPIKAGRSLALTFLTLGVYGFVAHAKLMRFWWEIQVTEQDFDDKLSQV